MKYAEPSDVVTSVDKAADGKKLHVGWFDLSVGQSDVLPAVHLENKAADETCL